MSIRIMFKKITKTKVMVITLTLGFPLINVLMGFAEGGILGILAGVFWSILISIIIKNASENEGGIYAGLREYLIRELFDPIREEMLEEDIKKSMGNKNGG